jgi:short-subunit dehydrogenase
MVSSTFHKNTVIITGASSGIGRELALQLADAGANLALASRNRHRLEKVASECHQRGSKAIAIPTDVSLQSDCKNLVDRTLKEYDRIDTLINNAAISMAGNFEEFPNLQVFESVVQANFFGSVYCTYHALPHLKKSKGRIVSVSCLGGKVAGPHHTGYCASKFAMSGFFDSLRLELMEMKADISVTTIYPDFVVTELLERAIEPNGKPLGEVGKKFYTDEMMDAQTCAKIILKAAAQRRRQIEIPLQSKLGLWLNFLAPNFTDRLIAKIGLAHRQKIENLRQTVPE